MTAVVVESTEVAIGADCARSDIAGVFTTSGSTFHAVSPALTVTTAPADATIDVARLASYRRGLAVLLEMPTSVGATYEAAWKSTPSSRWTMGPALVAGPLLSASVTRQDGFSIVTGLPPNQYSAAFIEPTEPRWVRLADPPAHTATISINGSNTDALAVNHSTFIDYRLTSGRWGAVQTLKVPVPIGSSG